MKKWQNVAFAVGALLGISLLSAGFALAVEWAKTSTDVFIAVSTFIGGGTILAFLVLILVLKINTGKFFP